MKKIITLCLVLAASVSLYAQQVNLTQFATLTHNDTVTGQWYGPTAFVSAHDAAVHGDIITLSPGIFNSSYFITKAITIRGHGMLFDPIANTAPTEINGIICLDIPDLLSQGQQLTIEGIKFNETLVYSSVFSPIFRKCKFHSIRKRAYEGSGMSNPVFSDCIVGVWDGSNYITNAMFTKSVIMDSRTGTQRTMYLNGNGTNWYEANWYTPGGESQDVYYNCIINIPPSYTSYKRMIVNSILYSTDATQSTSTNVSNTIAITDSINYFATPSAGNNTNIHGFESIFKTFRGTYTEGETFELTPQAASTYLGADNTQVGIYGGSSPFNSKATDPRILKISPAYSSNGNGQLPVTIQLRAQ